MDTNKLDSILEEIKGEILLDLVHTMEELSGRKPVRRLATADEIKPLDYLFACGLYPIEEDRDYLELGEIFDEEE